MKTIVVSSKQVVGGLVSQADQAVLAAVARFLYLTATQLGRLLYPACHDEFRYARRRLARLADAGLLLRLPGLPPRGTAPSRTCSPWARPAGSSSGWPSAPSGLATRRPKRPTTKLFGNLAVLL